MVASNIGTLMRQRKKTIRSLAKETGLATLTITRARDGRIAECRLSTLALIAQALGCGIKDLFEETGPIRKAARATDDEAKDAHEYSA